MKLPHFIMLHTDFSIEDGRRRIDEASVGLALGKGEERHLFEFLQRCES